MTLDDLALVPVELLAQAILARCDVGVIATVQIQDARYCNRNVVTKGDSLRIMGMLAEITVAYADGFHSTFRQPQG